MNKLRTALAASLLALGMLAGASVQSAVALDPTPLPGQTILVPMYDVNGNIVGYRVVRSTAGYAS